MATITSIANRAVEPDARKQIARDLGSFYVYEYLRADGDPSWDELSGLQRASLRAAFLIGAASVKKLRGEQ